MCTARENPRRSSSCSDLRQLSRPSEQGRADGHDRSHPRRHDARLPVCAAPSTSANRNVPTRKNSTATISRRRICWDMSATSRPVVCAFAISPISRKSSGWPCDRNSATHGSRFSSFAPASSSAAQRLPAPSTATRRNGSEFLEPLRLHALRRWPGIVLLRFRLHRGCPRYDTPSQAISIGVDPYVMIRPEGRWHVPGILERSAIRR